MVISQAFSPPISLSFILGASLLSHVFYNRKEPTSTPATVFLLCVVPISLSFFTFSSYPLLFSVILTCGSYYFSLVASIITYRLSPFHPLSRYPGPTLLKISRACLFNKAKFGKLYLYVQDLHDRYGDIVRVGPNEVSIRDASAVKPTYGLDGLPKGPSWPGRTMQSAIPALIAITDPEFHARRRKPWLRALAPSALKDYEPTIAKRVSQLLDCLIAQQGVVNLSRWITYFFYDLTNELSFGGGSELMEKGDVDGRLKKTEEGLRKGYMFDHVPWLAIFAKHIPSIRNSVVEMREFNMLRARTRMQAGTTTKDLFYYLSNEDGAAKESPDPVQVSSDGSLVVLAGSDTTGSAVCNAFYFLLRRLEVYKKLQAEIDQVYPPGESALDSKPHKDLPYLDAVINETLRLYPVIIAGYQRRTPLGSGGKLIGPYFIPEGNQVRVHTYSIQRDPRYFSRPETFWPERWLIADGRASIPPDLQGSFVHNTEAYIPFSLGPESCVGKPLALLEMRMLISHVLQNLKIEFAEGWDSRKWEENIEDLHAIEFGELLVTVEPRT